VATVATGLTIAALSPTFGIDEAEGSALRYLLAIVAGVALVVRRRHPLPVLALVSVLHVAVAWDTATSDIVLSPALAIALYTLARHGNRQRSLTISLVIGLVAATLTGALGGGTVAEVLSEMPEVLLPIVVADLLRTREDRVRDLIETEAESRVQAERLRIARDVHDIVAHGLSVITVQSGVAAYTIERDPAGAKVALEEINATGKRALEDLRAVVGVLRSTDEAAELRPTPTDPDDLGELVEQAGKAGVAVTTDIRGAFPADVSDAAVVALHRIVQESLTNVARHAGSVRALVLVEHDHEAVTATIRNDAPTLPDRRSVPSTGVGVAGMTERAESLGGTLWARPRREGGFEVTARIPYYRPAGERAEDPRPGR
jgi:signal transduction histidine kinase